MATTLTVYADASDKYLYSTAALTGSESTGGLQTAYAKARDGIEAVGVGTDPLVVGQYKPSHEFGCFETFLAFDTSALPDAAILASATLSVWLVNDYSTRDFTINARLHDFGATVTTADWVAGQAVGAITADTLLATLSTSGIGAVGAYKAFTSETAFVDNVSLTGTTYIMLTSDRFENPAYGTYPLGNEYVTLSHNGGAGTAKLDIVYSLGGSATITDSLGITDSTAYIDTPTPAGDYETSDVSSSAGLTDSVSVEQTFNITLTDALAGLDSTEKDLISATTRTGGRRTQRGGGGKRQSYVPRRRRIFGR